jgi:hypothetical protein
VNAKIREYEARKIELTEKSEGTGVKAMRAKNELAQLISSPLAEVRSLVIFPAFLFCLSCLFSSHFARHLTRTRLFIINTYYIYFLKEASHIVNQS